MGYNWRATRAAVLLLLALAVAGAFSRSAAQERSWIVGDKVEVEDIYTGRWEEATVIVVNDWRSSGMGLMYKVKLDSPPPRGESELLLRPGQIRARGGAAAAGGDNDAANGAGGAVKPGGAPARGAFKSGDEVLFLDQFARATILEADGNNYKIHLEGCKPGYMDQWVDRSKLEPLKALSAQDPDVRALMGNWALLTVGNSSWAVAWGGHDRLQINPNGTYVWEIDKGIPTVRGRWVTDAKAEGIPANGGYARHKSANGIIIKDNEGREWKVYKFAFDGDPTPRIAVRHMCEGKERLGKRM